MPHFWIIHQERRNIARGPKAGFWGQPFNPLYRKSWLFHRITTPHRDFATTYRVMNAPQYWNPSLLVFSPFQSSSCSEFKITCRDSFTSPWAIHHHHPHHVTALVALALFVFFAKCNSLLRLISSLFSPSLDVARFWEISRFAISLVKFLFGKFLDAIRVLWLVINALIEALAWLLGGFTLKNMRIFEVLIRVD